jgi:two-component system, cell cycle sensor histidine kinase and response regulator CckA
MSRSHRVLIVEDEGLISHDIATRLETLGHVVVDTVSTADEAVEMAPQADVILMDIRIDGPRDGIEAAREIRERYHLPVIFLTAHADRSTLDRAKITGPFAYLIKPLATASLQSAIEVAIYKHRMERNLEEQEAWLRTTLASVADATVVTGPDGAIRTLNRTAQELTGWSSDEAAGQPYAKVLRFTLPGSAGEAAPEPVELALLQDRPVDFDPRWRLIARSGQELAIEGSAAPVRDPHSVFGAVLTFRDVTARRWQEEQVRQAQRMDTAARLAANVSQEYSNLVAIVGTQAEHLLAQIGEYSPARRALEEIRQAASAASQITRRLAAFGHRPASQPDAFTMNSLLRRMAKFFQSAAGERIKVVIKLDAASGRIRANLDQIEQAVMNLVLQACAAMPEGGEILIETKQKDISIAADSDSFVALSVSYPSREIDLEHIFEPVASQDQSLALPVAHAIVRDHGGYLTAQPTTGGTRLEMLLPRIASQALLDPVAETPTRAPSILLVDSREGLRSQLHNFFESAGYNLLEAADVHEAVTLGQMHEGCLDLLIAEKKEAEEIAEALRSVHPTLAVLRVVDRPEQSPDEVRQPFSQRVLLEKAGVLLGLMNGQARGATAP